MTDEQKELAINNIELMHFLLNKYKNEFYDFEIFLEFKEQFIVRYIQACMTYDKTIGTFSAYLSKTVYLYFLNFLERKIHKINNLKNGFSLQEIVYTDDKDIYLEDVIEDAKSTKNIVYNSKINEMLEYARNSFHDNEFSIFIKYLSGSTQVELANKYNISQAQISRIIRKIQKTIRSEFK